MPRKPITEGGRKELILDAALSLFLENGYEKTSIRMISSKVGCEVGLVYYYFKTKDDVFQSVLHRYLDEIETRFEKFTQEKSLSSSQILENLLIYIEEIASDFRKTFTGTVHATICSDLRIKIAEICEKTLLCLLEKQEQKDASALAVFLANGFCSAAFRDNENFYLSNKSTLLETAKTLFGTNNKETASKKREIPSFLL